MPKACRAVASRGKRAASGTILFDELKIARRVASGALTQRSRKPELARSSYVVSGTCAKLGCGRDARIEPAPEARGSHTIAVVLTIETNGSGR